MFFDLQKASMLKRISAWILDLIVFSVIATGFCWLISVVINYDVQYQKLEKYYGSYEKEFGLSLSITDEDYSMLDDEKAALYEEMFDKMNSDKELSRQYAFVMNLTLLIMSIGFLLAFILAEIIIPLILKDGRTIGKKIFGICLMQTDHTKLRMVSLAIRVILGKYAIETMVPLLILIMIFFNLIGITGTITIILLMVLQLAVLFMTKSNQALHDLLAGTVVVDAKSQMIFENQEAMAEFKKQSNYSE